MDDNKFLLYLNTKNNNLILPLFYCSWISYFLSHLTNRHLHHVLFSTHYFCHINRLEYLIAVCLNLWFLSQWFIAYAKQLNKNEVMKSMSSNYVTIMLWIQLSLKMIFCAIIKLYESISIKLKQMSNCAKCEFVTFDEHCKF